MNPIPDLDPSDQPALRLTTRLGELAARQPLSHPAPPSGPSPSPLHAILAHLRRRPTAWEEAERNARINDLLVGG